MVFGGISISALVKENFDRVQHRDFTMLQETHAILSGAKAYYTSFALECNYWCRVSCGGHGFAHYSGLPQLYFEKSSNVTLEGENTVIYLQLARYLLKMYKAVHKSPDKIPHKFRYLLHLDEPRLQADTEPELLQLASLKQLLTQSGCAAVKKALKIMQDNIGMSFENILNRKACNHTIFISLPA